MIAYYIYLIVFLNIISRSLYTEKYSFQQLQKCKKKGFQIFNSNTTDSHSMIFILQKGKFFLFFQLHSTSLELDIQHMDVLYTLFI